MSTVYRVAVLGLDDCIKRLAPLHGRFCPRQVLGARMGLYAGQLLGLDLPQKDKRLFTFVETDGCFSDGIAVATGCGVGARTLRVEDFGKIAATFVDTLSGAAIRVHPHPEAREAARAFAPDAPSRWHAQRDGYQVMPAQQLLQVEDVILAEPLAAILGEDDFRVTCSRCDEEVIDRREVVADGQILCRACAGSSYYQRNGSLASPH
jgi:formylmethanofuran dehydrogenase subunit E